MIRAVQLAEWFLLHGATGPLLPATPLGPAWRSSFIGFIVLHFVMRPRPRYLLSSCAFWLASIHLATRYLSAVCLLLHAYLTAAPYVPHLLLLSPRSPLPLLVLLALCWEPWAHKAQLDWHAWQHGIDSLPLLQSMPPERAWDSWWPLSLLCAGLRSMVH